MAKILGLDIHQTVVVLSTMVKKPNETGYQKFIIMIKYFNNTKKHYLVLSSDDLKWLSSMSKQGLQIHPNFKSHT